MLFHCRDVPQFIVNNAVVNIFLHLYVFSFRINFQKWNSYVTSYEHFSVSSYLLPNCPAEGIFVSIYVSTSSIWECSFHHFLIYNLIVCLFIRGEKRYLVVVLCLLFQEFLIWLKFACIHCFIPSVCDIFQFVGFFKYVGPRSYTILLMKNTKIASCHIPYKTWIYFVVNLNGAYPKLVPFRPAGRLISPPLLLSVILNILLSLAMHIVGFILVQRQPWYSLGIHR